MKRDDIPRIPRAVTARVCPGCGYEMPQTLVGWARLDFPCPRCWEHTLREFPPIQRPEDWLQ